VRYVEGMRTPDTTVLESVRDVSLPGGCILCGGDLALRVTPGGARTVCVPCRWISSPDVERGEENAIQILHPAAAA